KPRNARLFYGAISLTPRNSTTVFPQRCGIPDPVRCPCQWKGAGLSWPCPAALSSSLPQRLPRPHPRLHRQHLPLHRRHLLPCLQRRSAPRPPHCRRRLLRCRPRPRRRQKRLQPDPCPPFLLFRRYFSPFPLSPCRSVPFPASWFFLLARHAMVPRRVPIGR